MAKKNEKDVTAVVVEPQAAEAPVAEPQGAMAGQEGGTEPAGEPQEAGAGEAAAELTQRDRYRQRYRDAYPDMAEDDDEALYGQANANLDELENYRKSNEELAKVFDQNPTFAAMLLAAKDGQNPFAWMVEQGGPDLDVRELVNDEEFGKKMSEALMKHQEAQLKSQKEQEAMKTNIKASVDALKALQAEKKLADDEAVALWTRFFDEIVDDAEKGIVKKDTWEAILKAQNYEADITAARDTAAAQALNSRAENPLKKFDDSNMPPSLGTGNSGRQPKVSKKKNEGSFADFGLV